MDRGKPKSMRGIISILLAAIVVLSIVIPEPKASIKEIDLPPSASHWLGTTPGGYDLLWLIVHATLVSGKHAAIATFLAAVLGGLIGWAGALGRNSLFDRLQGFSGGAVDSLGPFILCASWLSIAPRSPSWMIYLVFATTAWPGLAAIIRGAVLELSERGYVISARTIGCPERRILWTHMGPDLWLRSRAYLGGLFSSFVGLEGALGFLGLGIGGQGNLGYLLFDFQASYTSLDFIATVVALLILVLGAQSVARAL